MLRARPDSSSALLALAARCGATRVLWNRRYEPARHRARSAHQRRRCATRGTRSRQLQCRAAARTLDGADRQRRTVPSVHAVLAPLPVAARSGRTAAGAAAPRRTAALARIRTRSAVWRCCRPPDWAGGLRAAWTPGQRGRAARARSNSCATAFDDYASSRDRPALHGTSRLSPHLHFGEIGPREIWHATRPFRRARGQHTSAGATRSSSPSWAGASLPITCCITFRTRPISRCAAKFARFPWKSEPAGLAARGSAGATGYPIVDAGMRELWRTGWMHNRVRMIAASFLVKDLLLPWNDGARWFWDTLVDADLASNTLGWQWVAGCGADAAPFFRIFNPMPAGREVRSGRRLRAALGARNSRGCRTSGSTSRGPPRRPCWQRPASS